MLNFEKFISKHDFKAIFKKNYMLKNFGELLLTKQMAGKIFTHLHGGRSSVGLLCLILYCFNSPIDLVT